MMHGALRMELMEVIIFLGFFMGSRGKILLSSLSFLVHRWHQALCGELGRIPSRQMYGPQQYPKTLRVSKNRYN